METAQLVFKRPSPHSVLRATLHPRVTSHTSLFGLMTRGMPPHIPLVPPCPPRRQMTLFLESILPPPCLPHPVKDAHPIFALRDRFPNALFL